MNCLITGANTGIGKAAALSLIRRDPTLNIIFGCRSQERAQAAKDDIIATLSQAKDGSQIACAERIEQMSLDLSDLNSVRNFCIEFSNKNNHLDILILNAGLLAQTKELTKQNHEMMFGVNHLGHFVLTNLLLPLLRKSQTKCARIVVVASDAHRFHTNLDISQIANTPDFGLTSSMNFYGRSKLCNILFTSELEKRLAKEDGCDATSFTKILTAGDPSRKISVNCLHPGAVHTEMARATPWYLSWIVTPISRIFFKTAEQGAETSVHLAISPEVEGFSGGYYDNCKQIVPSANALESETGAKLWQYSEEIAKEFLVPL
eukprot:TRINITY_DN618_c0_g1_i4.p1 TRINITY_DN618_c0_g1~~TRINITY_DN618_c0_g1_i4.p1  ORF type:complete len:319 (+),score=106.18 TRINITY_DN618_c0_g1_i4:40-996(+)